ncbi:MAG: hypothetical protein L0271_12145 [Gemmatimonadetes bacterium]|nr:hypothetical protein [Gemmatimonadota bacterium]
MSALYALPSQASGQFECYPGQACPSILLRSDADITILSGIAAAVWSLRGRGFVRPYLVAGAGFKRYRYEWQDAVTFVEAGEHSETPVAVHGGLGATFHVGGATLWLEAGAFWTPEGGVLESEGNDRLFTVGRRPQHDLSVVAGWRLLRF